MAHTRSLDLHTALDRDLAALSAPGETVTSFIRSLLADRRRLPHGPRFANLLDEVFGSLELEELGQILAAPEAISASQLWSVYARRRAALDSRFGSRFTTLFSRYSQHFLMRNPYTDAPNLLHHVYGLGVHLATLRLLVVGHPRLAAVLASDPHPDDDRQILDEVVVHVVQTFTKAVSHHPAFLRAAGLGAGTDEDAMTFGRLVLLAKFV